MKFIHTSDWHLGRSFHGVNLLEDQSFALNRLEEIIKEEHPDVLLVCGDVYDRSVPPVEAVCLLDDFIMRIVKGLHIPMVMIAGNHDSPERLSFASQLLNDQGLHVFGILSHQMPVVLQDEHGPVQIHGIPYAEPAEVRAAGIWDDVQTHDEALQVLLNRCMSGSSSGRNIVLAHAFVAGGNVSESERRLSIGGVSEVQAGHFRGFNYAALGHLHRPQQANGTKVQYSGSLLKYSFSEEMDKKGIVIGEMDKQGNVATEFIEITPRHDVRCMEGRFSEMEKPTGSRKSREDYLEITLTDRGPVLDAMERLRKIYPKLLNIRRSTLEAGDNRLKTAKIDPQWVDSKGLFSSFFKQVTGEELTADEEKAFAGVLGEVEKEQRDQQ